MLTATSHSSYNALQTSLSGNVGHGGPSLQAGYTWGKSLDDVSGIIGGTGSTGAVTLFSPQDPFDTQAERGPSSFDVTHAFTLSAAQDLHFEHLGLQSDRTQPVDEGLGVAEHLDDHEWFAVYGLFGNPADGRGNKWRGPAGPDRNYRTFRAPAVQRDRATIILGGARTTEASFRFPSGSRAGLDRTPGALEHSAVILFEARHIMTSILRSSRQLRLATGKAVWSERTCNSAQSYLICLTSSTWGYPRTSSRVQGLA